MPIQRIAPTTSTLLEPIEYGFDETWYGGATWDDATTIDVTGATYVDIALSDTASIDSGSLARAEIAPPSAGAVAPIAATLDSYSATASSAPATLGGAPRTPTLGRWGTWSVIETSAVGIRPAHALSAYDPVADTIAPSVPGNLAGDVKSGSEIDLSWSASTDNVAVAGYRLYRDGDLIATVGSTSWFDTALVAGSTHTYTVSAIDAAGNESALSASLTKTTPRLAPIDATAPSSPTGVAASATSSPYGVSVSWTASTDNIGVTRYSVSRNGAVIGVVSGAATGFFDATTVASSAYTYTVTASDAAGNVSAASSGAALTTPATSPPTDTSAPSIPADLVATAVNTSEIDLSWTASSDDVGVAGYRIYRDGTLVATTVSTSYADTPVGPATSHTYTLAAFDGAGNLSAQGTSASAATPASDTMAPTTPTGVAAVSTAWNTVTVSWTASTDAVGVSAYTVRRNGAVVGSVSGAATSYIDATTAASTAYTYTLTASDAAGNTSAASSAAPVTSAAYEPLPDTSGPSLPAGLSAAAAPKGIDLAWSASTDNVAVAGYRITRDGTLIATTVSTAYADTDLVPGVPHTYTVTAFDAAGNTSAASTASASAYPLPLTALTYTYDLADRLTAITTASGATTSFGIDALGRHASRTVGTSPTETYGYLGTTDAVVSIAAGGTTTTSAIDATGSRVATASGGSFGYTLPDLHGNVAAALDAAGTTISDAFLYDAYGDIVAQVTSGLPTPWRYQGRILESATGTPDLYDFAARSYAPALGTFTSLDTSLGSALNPHLLNGYLYADANPATLVDPDGHCAARYGEDCSPAGTATGTGPGAGNLSAEIQVEGWNTGPGASNLSAEIHVDQWNQPARVSTSDDDTDPPVDPKILPPGWDHLPTDHDLWTVYTDCWFPGMDADIHLGCMQNRLGKQLGLLAFLKEDDGRDDLGADRTIQDVLLGIADGFGVARAENTLEEIASLEQAAADANGGLGVPVASTANMGKLRYLLGLLDPETSSTKTIGDSTRHAVQLSVMGFGSDTNALWSALKTQLADNWRNMVVEGSDKYRNFHFNIQATIDSPDGPFTLNTYWLLRADGTLDLGSLGLPKP